MGFYTEVEHNTTDGRIDQIVKTANYIYIIVFKLDQSATEALRQIDEKVYSIFVFWMENKFILLSYCIGEFM